MEAVGVHRPRRSMGSSVELNFRVKVRRFQFLRELMESRECGAIRSTIMVS